MSKQVKTNQPIPAASFGWYYGKDGSIKTVVSKPFTLAEIKGRK